MIDSLPVPIINPDSAAYWEGACSERLLIRRCRICRTPHFMPRYLCPHCWSNELNWEEASGRGSVYSFSVIRRASIASMAARVPYVLALIDLEEGPRMMSNIVGDDALEVQIGDTVQVCFETRGEESKLPQFHRIVE